MKKTARIDYGFPSFLSEDEFLTRKQALEMLDRSDRVLYKRRDRGHLNPIKVGHRVFYRRAEVEEMREKQEFIYGLPRGKYRKDEAAT
jgi:helix-turn-helix protein